MSRFLGRYSPVIYALLRIIVGLLFVCHGGQKVLGMFASSDHKAMPFEPFSMMGVAGLIELIGGFLVAVGLFADWAAFLCSGLMAVAYFMAHAKGGFFPIQNHGEPAVLYCWIFLYIAFHGSGILSLEQLLLNNRPRNPAEAKARITSIIILILSVPVGVSLSYFFQSGALRLVMSFSSYLQHIPDLLRSSGPDESVRDTLLLITAITVISACLSVFVIRRKATFDSKAGPSDHA